MRHAVRGRKLGRQDAHRKSLFRNQLASLIRHERIRTTITKAKELRPLAEKLVTLARRKGTDVEKLHHRRLASARLVDPVAVKRLFDTIAPRFTERPGGYTRILKLGKMRKGDNAELAILEFVDYVFESKDKKADAKKAAAKKPEDSKGDDKKAEAKPKKEKATAEKKPVTRKAAAPKADARPKGAATRKTTGMKKEG